jgi:hypothetical protein
VFARVLTTEEDLVKLAFCVVVGLSLLGCADEAAQGGGQGDGIVPSKISFVDPEPEKPFDARDVFEIKQKLGTAPADAICEGCIVNGFSLVDNSYGITEVRVVSDGGLPVCRIFLNQDGIVIDECGWSRP